MLPYLILMAVPVGFALILGRRKAWFAMLFGFIFFTAFTGLRYETGPDWWGYLFHAEAVKYMSLSEALQQPEPGYWLLAWLSQQAGTGMVGTNFVSAFIFCAGMFRFASTTDRPWIAVAVATSYLVLSLGMSGIRQAIAMGLIFFMLADWSRSRILTKLVLIAVASLFHFSALLMLLLLAFGQRSGRMVQIGAVVAASLGFVVTSTQADSLQLYIDRYVGAETVQATGAIFHALLNAIPAAVYLLFRARWNRNLGPDPVLLALAVGSIAVVPMLAVSTVGVSRVSMYLTPAAMIIWAGLPRVLGGRSIAEGVAFGALSVQVAVMFAWLNFANVAFAYFPYQNVLLRIGSN